VQLEEFKLWIIGGAIAGLLSVALVYRLAARAASDADDLPPGCY